jgi:phosphoribosylformimino-5-aminoimidazole carboxamide ribotide isomerase
MTICIFQPNFGEEGKIMPEHTIEVIPAIDLRGGVVVRARKGLRQSYAPIVTTLARSSAPRDVVTGLLTIHPFRTIYIADLDRIERRGSNGKCLEELRKAFSALAFWVDAGISDAAGAHAWLARHAGAHLVLGSESLESLSVLEDPALAGRTLLSLDYRGDDLLGPGEIWDKPQLWAARVIVMTLARVGTNSGPDLDRLAKVRRRAPNTQIYAAGGLRDASDLIGLKEAGMSGVLVTSALHDGRLKGADLAEFKLESDTEAK